MKKPLLHILTLTFLLSAKADVFAQTPSNDTLLPDSLSLPQGMQDQEIDSMLHQWNVRNFLSTNEECTSSGENPTFQPEVYISRLSRLPNVIEVPYNDVVKSFIDRYCERLRKSVSVMLGASNFYNPIFEQALETYQLPLELKYLPIIESALNPGATSKVGAAGLWQFMIATGKQYGLEVTSLVDERRDPIKSSYAAAQYLKDLYEIFGDWTLVIASYNCGPGNVNKAIKRAGGEKDYWKICSYLPRETQGYVPAFIAANYVMNYYCEHNICPVSTTLPPGTDTLSITRDVQMEAIVSNCGISMEELKALNPHYRTNLIPGEKRPCTLRLPAQGINAFIEKSDSIYAQSQKLTKNRKTIEVPVSAKGTTSTGAKTITVKNGDTLGAIAKRNRTTIAKIQKLNGLKGTNIRAGQRLRVK